MCGHSELATGLRFTNDCRRLISASGDGCIFVWRVPHDMVVTMHARLSQQAMRQGKTLESNIFTDNSSAHFYEPENEGKFTGGQLPLWVKKHISDETASSSVTLTKEVSAPQGRWAQRAEKTLNPKSFYGDFSFGQDKRVDSDGSKYSSLESGVDVRRYSPDVKKDVKQEEDFTPSSESFYQIHQNVWQVPTNNITVRNEARKIHLTDDSGLGSLRDHDVESNAHDGDIDSEDEFVNQSLYYPPQVDSARYLHHIHLFFQCFLIQFLFFKYFYD